MEFTDLIRTAKVDDVTLIKPGCPKSLGTLCLTSHHIIFDDRSSEEMIILYMFVEHLEKKISSTSGLLSIICKDLTTFRFKISGQEESFNVAASIEALSTMESAASYYPFFLNRIPFKIVTDGWEMFSMRDEYEAMIGESDSWRVANVNAKYELCDSYSRLVVVPFAATNEMIKKSARFRQAGRFPVLTYLHTNGVPLLRCSQPLCGPGGKRCKDDERLLSLALSGHAKKGCIVDTRFQQAALSHRGKGGGFETDDNYAQWKRIFHDIESYQSLADCVQKLYEACTDKKSLSWFSKLEASGWMAFVQDVLSATLNTARYVHLEASPTLVHGEKGTDFTLLVTSLVQILLHPNSRTILGFESLVIREWLWGGYPFSERHLKLGVSPNKRKGQGPVFLLFLDCVHQVMMQYPTSFEFTEEFLLLLAEHVYASEYGTFLFNSELQREQSKLSERTVSLWSYLNRDQIFLTMLNSIYETNTNVLWPSVSPQSLCLWANLFLKTELSTGVDSRTSLKETIVGAKTENDRLKKQAKLLQRQYKGMRLQMQL